jgi:hypothetical protein
MKQIYGWMSGPEADLEVALTDLRNRMIALELEMADLRTGLRAERALRTGRPEAPPPVTAWADFGADGTS